MGAKGKLHGDFDLPIDYVGELVAASLRDGWRNLNYNDLLLEITADQNKTQNLSGFSLKNDFQATVRWQPQGERVRVSVEVLDREQQALERDCRKMAHAILQGVSERGATIKSSLARAKPRTNHGSARWATNEDLEKAGYVTDWEGGNKLLLGPGPGGKNLALPEDLTAMHSVVCGPTGCGKSSSIFIPNLIERVGISAIVTEATAGSEPPDLLSKTAGWRQKHGSKVFYFNPDDLSSTRVNPVDQVTTIAKAQSISDLIIRNTLMTKNTGGDPIWETSERHLLTSLLMHVSAEKGDLAMVRRLLIEGADRLGQFWQTAE